MSQRNARIAFMASFLLVALAATSEYPSFEQYCANLGKNYSQEDYPVRKQIYEDRIASFSAITSYQPAVNNLTDWTSQEIDSLSNLQVLQESERPAQTKSVGASDQPRRVSAPSSLDWNAKGMVTSVKDQGTCGSCWSFAATAAGESFLIKQGKYSRWEINLSEQKLLQCTRYSSCNGGYLENAMKSVLKCPSESQFPYSPYNSYPNICSAQAIQVADSNKDFYSLSDSDLISLLQDGPVVISISSQNWENYGSGVFSCSHGASIDHAVLLIGYTPTYWIMKNSWGSGWGMNGFIHITRNPSNNCQIGSSAHVLAWEKWYHCLVGTLIAVLLAFI